MPHWVSSLRPSSVAVRHTLRVSGGKVISGPFAGMQYIDAAVGSAHLPKIAGTYESELAPAIEAEIKRGPKHLVDIGSAEGYYAVGLAWRIPGMQVTTFETSKEGRALMAKLAVANRVYDRFTVHGTCTPEDLAATLQKTEPGLLICDIEGGEMEVLDVDAVPDLAKWNILCEVHDCIRAGITEELRARFAPFSDIAEIRAVPRTSRDLPTPVRNPMLRPWLTKQLDEYRPGPMTWLYITPRTSR